MKKFAKMSLVAAIAVVGFNSTASATDLSEAIKGVDISGMVRYRIEDRSGATQNEQDFNIDVTVKVPVNDNVTFIANANFDNDSLDVDDTEAKTATRATVLDNYYFQYANGPLTVNLGTQDIPGRMTDGLVGQGIVGLYNLGAFTIGAAGFYNDDLVPAEDLYSVIAMGSVGPVSLLGQWADIADTGTYYNLKADASVGPVKAGVEYTDRDLEADDLEYYTLKAYVGASVGIVSANLTYAKTGEDGSGSIDQEIEAPAEYLMWQLASFKKADFSVWSLDVSAKVTDTISLRAAYADGEYSAANTDISEYLGQVSYKMSKNLDTYIRYSNYESEGADDRHRGRVEIKYTF